MRTIKFRAWDEDLKMMMPAVDLSGPLQEYKWLGRVDLPLMQFTELYDKNGKEIYEGDIVQCTEEKKGSETGKRKIVFALSEWKTARLENGEDFYKHCLGLNWGGWESFEIIGDIYTTPELLPLNHPIEG